MKKIQEILFLQNLKGIKKSTIFNKYWDVLCKINDPKELSLLIRDQYKEHFINEISQAFDKSDKMYNDLLKQNDIKIITVFDDNYPKKLNVMKDNRPLIIYVKGNVNLLEQLSIAIVGTRKPSNDTIKIEKSIIKYIFDYSNRVIVSGLAVGCDRIAHEVTLSAGKETLAVLPSGVNVITPPLHAELASEMIKNNGCIISEYNIDTKPDKRLYIERDRVIAALSDMTFVVECDIKSGKMHTVNAAKRYKRKVYCFYPKEAKIGAYSGNKFIIEKKVALR